MPWNRGSHAADGNGAEGPTTPGGSPAAAPGPSGEAGAPSAVAAVPRPAAAAEAPPRETAWRAPDPATRRRVLPDAEAPEETGRTVLVTGASGMLGREVALGLIRGGHRVTAFQRSDAKALKASLGERGRERLHQHRGTLTDPDAVERALDGADAVIHLAAKVSVSGPWEEYEEANVRGTRVLLQLARWAGVRDVVYVSSPSVSHAGSSFMGQANEPADPCAARGNYARSKAYGERLALEADGEDLRVGVVRPHLVWGPGDTQLVERILERASRGGLPLLDQGAALIDSTYVTNAADAIVRCLERIDAAHGRPLVVTNGEPRTVGELLTGMCRAAGVPEPVRRIPSPLARLAGRVIEKVWERRPGEDEPPMTEFLAEQLSTAHWFDQRETREVLDWMPAVSIDAGMERLREYYRG